MKGEVKLINYRKIKELRKSRGLTQYEVAGEVGISLTQYKQKEKGVVEFSASEFYRLSQVLGVSISELYEV